MQTNRIHISDIIGCRLDAFYYNPEFIEIENKLKSKTDKKLGDYIKFISSGATPKSDDASLYSDKDNGVPFLRVQNITEEGLNLSDVKYITKEVHNKMLKRTQLKEDDLLITITGRLGSCAVIPKSFVGNINQHSVKIETGNKNISENLSAYLKGLSIRLCK